MRIVFTKPSQDEPGFLIRVRKALEFQELIKKKEVTPVVIDSMVTFLADYIEEPADKAQAIEAIWNASEKEFLTMLNGITGDTPDNPLAPNGGASGPT